MRCCGLFFTGVFFLVPFSFAGQAGEMTSDDFVSAVFSQANITDTQQSQSKAKWFYVNVYGGGSYQSFPNTAQSKYQSSGDYYDIFQPASHWNFYYAAKLGIRPFEYLSFGLGYWNAGTSSSNLIYQAENGDKFKNGQSQMSFSGINFYTTAHIPLWGKRHELQLSVGPSIILSSFDPELTVTKGFAQALKKTNKTNIRPFIAAEYQYMLGDAFSIGAQVQYILGTGSDISAPYNGGSYIPSMLNLSVSLGYQF